MSERLFSPTLNRLYLSVLFAILLGFSFPSFLPLQLGFLAYWALIPLFYLFESCTAKQAMLWGYFAGFLWNALTLYWIGWATILGVLGVLVILPIYVSIFGWVHVAFREKFGKNFIFLMSAIWVSLEYIRSLGSLGFPWTALAHTQTYYTALIQYVDITGVLGVSFWVLWINVILFILIKERPPVKKTIPLMLVLAGLFALPYIYGKLVDPSKNYPKENIHIGMVQGNINPYLKWSEGFVDQNFAIYDSLTRSINNEELDLIVWPETATAAYVRNKPRYLNYLYDLSDEMNAALLTGSPDFKYYGDGEYEAYNSVLLFQPGQRGFQSYDKMILVPFGERVPLEDTFAFLHDFLEKLNFGTGDFSPGEELRLLKLKLKSGVVPTAGIVCYESIFPGHVRKLIKMGAELLVIITNDGWYGKTSAPYQHAQFAVFRAIENRVSIARCANTGISSFISPKGRILEESEFNQSYVGNMELPIRQELTFYSKYGEIFAMAVTGFSVVCILWMAFRRGRIA